MNLYEIIITKIKDKEIEFTLNGTPLREKKSKANLEEGVTWDNIKVKDHLFYDTSDSKIYLKNPNKDNNKSLNENSDSIDKNKRSKNHSNNKSKRIVKQEKQVHIKTNDEILKSFHNKEKSKKSIAKMIGVKSVFIDDKGLKMTSFDKGNVAKLEKKITSHEVESVYTPGAYDVEFIDDRSEERR